MSLMHYGILPFTSDCCRTQLLYSANNPHSLSNTVVRAPVNVDQRGRGLCQVLIPVGAAQAVMAVQGRPEVLGVVGHKVVNAAIPESNVADGGPE